MRCDCNCGFNLSEATTVLSINIYTLSGKNVGYAPIGELYAGKKHRLIIKGDIQGRIKYTPTLDPYYNVFYYIGESLYAARVKTVRYKTTLSKLLTNKLVELEFDIKD